MPLPAHAPAARPTSGKTVMSWQRLVTLDVCVPGPWSPPGHRPEMLPVDESAKMRGRLTTCAFSGAASGTWMTSMLKSAVSGSSFGSAPEHPASSSADRTVLVPEPYTYMLALSLGAVTSVCVCEPRHVCTAASCFGFVKSVMSKMRTPRKRSGLTAAVTP